MDLGLQGKTALVTGGTRGIGAGIALTLAAEGARVLVCGRQRASGASIRAEAKAAGVEIEFIVADLDKPSGPGRLADAALGCLGRVDILVNNVGGVFDATTPGRGWSGVPAMEWQFTFHKCVVSAIVLTGRLTEGMKANGWGRVINISSIAGLEPPDSTPPDYAAAKAAMTNSTVTLAHSLARTGVTANTVSPGPIMTDPMRPYFMRLAKERGWPMDPDEAERRYSTEVRPLSVGRLGRPDEVGAAVAFLASDRANFITGANLRIDGGACRSAF